MEKLDSRVRALAGPPVAPDDAVIRRARKALDELHQRRSRSKQLRRATLAGLSTTGIAAVLAALLIFSPSPSIKPQDRAPQAPTYAATTPLGVLLMQAATATRPSVVTTDYWYQRVRAEIYFTPDASKYGSHKTIPDVTTEETWTSSDGSSASSQGNGEVQTRPSDPAVQKQWTEAMSLPTDLGQLRSRLYADAQTSLARLQGDVASIDKSAYASSFVMSSITEYLRQPLQSETRANLYVLLAELADQGALKGQGDTVDGLGRKGVAFTAASTGDPKAGKAWITYIVDPASGELLESKQYIQGVPDIWETFEKSAFVSGLGVRA